MSEEKTDFVYSKGRDLDETARALEKWLTGRIEGASSVRVSDLTYPVGAGVSNETILFRAEVTHGSAVGVRELVLRIHPRPEYQLFLEPDFKMQFDLLRLMRTKGYVKVAEMFWYEDDTSVVGLPFFVMERLHGRVPVSMPVYNTPGTWLYEATPAQRRVVWETALLEMCRIHQVPAADAAPLVDKPQWGPTGIDQQLNYWEKSLPWSTGGHPPAFMLETLAWLRANRPAEVDHNLSWGDARMGNMMFGDDYRLVGVMDWEQASMSGPIQDLGWWLFFDYCHAQGSGLARLEGLGGRQETIDIWQDQTGKSAAGVEWYEAFTGFKVVTLSMKTASINYPNVSQSAMSRSMFAVHMCELTGIELPKE